MERFRFTIFLIIIAVLVILAGYWAFSNIESGADHVANQRIKELEKENKDLKKEIDQLLTQIPEEVVEEEVTEEIVEPELQEESSKYQDVIGELENMIDAKITLKKGSKGAYVGTVQKFLNIYNNTSNRADNDYGAKTIAAVKDFEQKEKLIITEEIGPKTFQVMIDWLKKQ